MKIPPYGKDLYLLIKQQFRPKQAVQVVIGQDAWKEAKILLKQFPHTVIVLPPNDSPKDYFWPVSGCFIILIDTSEYLPQLIENIVYCLFIHHADTVVYKGLNGIYDYFSRS